MVTRARHLQSAGVTCEPSRPHRLPRVVRRRPAAYVRTNPQFHAPQGKYDWLHKTVFVGTISPAPGGGAVIIRAFRVR